MARCSPGYCAEAETGRCAQYVLMELLGAKSKKEAATYAVNRTLQILRQQAAAERFLAAGDILLSPEEVAQRHRDQS